VENMELFDNIKIIKEEVWNEKGYFGKD